MIRFFNLWIQRFTDEGKQVERPTAETCKYYGVQGKESLKEIKGLLLNS